MVQNPDLIWGSILSTEYFAAVHAAKSALWIAHLVAEITSIPRAAVIIYEDNAACIQMATNPVVSARNRHFAMRMWWLRDQVTSKTIVFVQVPSAAQVADILTKILPAPVFLALRQILFGKTPMYYSK